MPLIRRHLIRLAVVLSAAASGASAQQRDTMVLALPGSGSLSFLAMGDWGHFGVSPQREVGVQMGVAAKALGASFVLLKNFTACAIRNIHE